MAIGFHPYLTFKNKYERGTVLALEIDKILSPGLILLKLPDEIKGSIHISELNWNLGLSQRDFKSLKLTDTLHVYVSEYDDKAQRVIFGRKALLKKPCDTEEWESLGLNIPSKGRIVEILKNKIIIELANGLFANAPLTMTPKRTIGEMITILPIRKIEHLNMIECTLQELLAESKIITEAITEKFEAEKVNNSFAPSDEIFTSFSLFSRSIYWKYIYDSNRAFIESAFERYPKLFSKAIDGKEPLFFEFHFSNSAFFDLKTKIAPAIFPGVENEREILTKLSEIKFWYTQFERQRRSEAVEQHFSERQFNLFNEQLSIKGIIDNDIIRIISIKSKDNSDSLRERQMTLRKNSVFFINRPLIFYYNMLSSPETTSNTAFISEIETRVRAQVIWEISHKQSIEVLEKQGKDFQIFRDYLETQIDFEIDKANDTELELSECKLSSNIQIDTTEFTGKPSLSGQIAMDDQVAIFIKKNNTKPHFIGRGNVTSILEGKLQISAPAFDINIISGGVSVKKIVSVKQYEVQLRILDSFFANKLDLESFYQIFHDSGSILMPKEPDLTFFNEALNKPGNPQGIAVKRAVGNQSILLIQGPPGTGKTTVITEIVRQLVAEKKKVLVTSQTHVAVDNVLEKIKEDREISIVRIGFHEAVSDFSKEHLIDFSLARFKEKINELNKLKIKILNDRIDGITLLTSNYDSDALWLKHVDQFESFFEYVDSLELEEVHAAKESLARWDEVISQSPQMLTGLFFKELDVVFGTCIGIATNKLFIESDIVFDTVILDEAGKANISETLTAISKAKNIILVGDHKQLPPFLDSERVEYFKKYNTNELAGLKDQQIKSALGASLFEYLQKGGILPDKNKIMLNVQHRMHPDIGNFVSQTFYQNELLNGENTNKNVLKLPDPFDKQMIFIDTSGDRSSFESRQDNSFFNSVEAQFIAKNIVPELIKNGIKFNDFAIVSPYTKQCEVIRESFQKAGHIPTEDLEIATLDSFQGKEYDVIIFSFTRSSTNKTVGFLDDARRLNVAFSRAKKKLILVGNSQTLIADSSHTDKYYTDLFKRLIKHVERHGNLLKLNEVKKKMVVQETKLDSIVKGKVKRLESYGAIIDLGNKRQGLIYITEITWEKISHPDQCLSLDQEVTVKVIGIEKDTGKIKLSIKQLEKSPIEAFSDKHRVNDVIMGELFKIIELKSGSFKLIISLTKLVQGICYVSQSRKNLQPGVKLKVQIDKIDTKSNTIKCRLINVTF